MDSQGEFNGFVDSIGIRPIASHALYAASSISTPTSGVSCAVSPSSSITTALREGDDVLLKDKNDGLVYLGIAVEIDEDCELCLVRFGDGVEKWGRLGKEVKPLTHGDEPDDDELPLEDSASGIQEEEMCTSRLNGTQKGEVGPVKRRTKESRSKKRSRANSPQISPKITPAHVLRARKELPYDFESLLWDENHQRNDKERYCYCGESGDWYKKMLQCRKCLQWFHLECTRSTTVPRTMLLGDRFYDFTCTLCTGTCEEEVIRLDLSWADALHLTLFNLTVVNNKKYHDLETSILPFLKRRWKAVQGPGCLLKVSRMESEFIGSLLSSHSSRFRCGSETNQRSNYWGLCTVAPPTAPARSHIPRTHIFRSKDGTLRGHKQDRDSSITIKGPASYPKKHTSYIIQRQGQLRRPAMKSSTDINDKEPGLLLPNPPFSSLPKPLQPLVLKLNTPSANEYSHGPRNSYKNNLLAIKGSVVNGVCGRKNSTINATKAPKIDVGGVNGSLLEPVPIMLSTDSPFDVGSGGLLGGYEFNNGWRNAKSLGIMKTKTESEAKRGNNVIIGSLDTFIPPPKDFDGYNNPFRYFNQEPPILIPQTTLTSSDLPSFWGRHGYHEMNRQHRSFSRRNRYSFLYSRKNSMNSSGDATPERDMDCSSSCSNSVDENIPCAFLNPPPLLDFSEPLPLAPPSPPASTSKILDSSASEKSPPILDLFPPPAAYVSTLPSESDTNISNNNSRLNNLNINKISNVVSNGISKSIRHKSMSRDLKCPSATNSVLGGSDNKNLTNGNICNNQTILFTVNARRLTLDGDIQYLISSNLEVKCEEHIISEDLIMNSCKDSSCLIPTTTSLCPTTASSSSSNIENPTIMSSNNSSILKGEEKVCKRNQNIESTIKSNCSLPTETAELPPANNTATLSPPSLVLSD